MPPPSTSPESSDMISPDSGWAGRKRSVDGNPKSLTTPSDPHGEFLQLQSMLEGREQAIETRPRHRHQHPASSTNDSTNPPYMARWYDSVFPTDGESLLRFDDHCPGQALPSPTAAQIFMLWRVYLECIHPISQLVDKSSTQETLLRFGDRIHEAPILDQALILSVLTLALTCMPWHEIPQHFDGKHFLDVISESQRATQTAISRCQIWKTHRWEAVQALTIYLNGLHPFVDPRVLSVHVGMADRIARRMALHREGSSRSEPPAVSQLKKKLWWEIHVLDQRCNEKFGAGASVLGESSSVSLPHLQPAGGVDNDITSFAVVKMEITNFYAKLRAQQYPHVGRSELTQWQAPLATKLNEIDRLEQHIIGQAQKVSRNSIENINRLADIYMRLHLARMRMLAYIETKSPTRDLDVLTQAMYQIQCELDWRDMDLFKDYQWFVSAQLPLLAYIYALLIVRKQPPGEAVQSAWTVMQKIPWLSLGLCACIQIRHDGKEIRYNNGSLFGPLLLKAWDTRNHTGIEEIPSMAQIRAQVEQSSSSAQEQTPSSVDISIAYSDTPGTGSASNGVTPGDLENLLYSQFFEEWWTDCLVDGGNVDPLLRREQ